MAWLPWQSTQTALPVSPDFLDAIPWTLCSYAAITFWSGRLYFFSIAWSLWHRRQVATMLSRKVLAAGSFGFRMSCIPWQSWQPGTSVTPFARSIPWELMAYDFSASPWHLPQETFFSFSCGAFASAWQVTHEPFPWTEARYACRST